MFQQQGIVDPIGLQAAERLLATNVCRSVLYCEQAASTNTLALEELTAGLLFDQSLPRLTITDNQTGGRGRHGRTWLSDQGSLTFSLTVSCGSVPTNPLQLTALATGVGLVRSLEYVFAPLRVRLKWPNDVVVGGGKVAGVLCEANQSAPGRLVIGVGINVQSTPPLPYNPSATPANSIAHSVGRPLGRYEALEEIVAQIIESIAELDRDRAGVLNFYRSRCLLNGQVVRCQTAGQSIGGQCQGINDDGELLIASPSGIVACRSGEAQLVRPC